MHLHLLFWRLNGPSANNCSFKHMPVSSLPIVGGPCCTLFSDTARFTYHEQLGASPGFCNAFGKTVHSQVYAREGERVFQILGVCAGASASGKPFRKVWAGSEPLGEDTGPIYYRLFPGPFLGDVRANLAPEIICSNLSSPSTHAITKSLRGEQAWPTSPVEGNTGAQLS